MFKEFVKKYKKALVNHYPNKVTEDLLVSICVQSYNHQDYIKKCLDGILTQQTNFLYEILLGEDESSDNTRKICIEYAKKYPDKIRLFLHSRDNVIKVNGVPTGRFNLLYNLYNTNGKYIALLDGDDYWTDPLKLQKQVDFLENNPSFSLCSGGYQVLNDNKIEKEVINEGFGGDENETGFSFDLDNTKDFWLTKSLTLVFRRELINISAFLEYKYFRDVHINYHLLKLGRGFYFKQILGVYRVHQGGVFSMKSRHSYLKNAYHLYSELYYKNRDRFSRYKYFKHCVLLLEYELYRTNLSFSKKNKLLRETKKIAQSKEERMLIFKAFNPKSFITQKLLYLKRKIIK